MTNTEISDKKSEQWSVNKELLATYFKFLNIELNLLGKTDEILKIREKAVKALPPIFLHKT